MGVLDAVIAECRVILNIPTSSRLNAPDMTASQRNVT
jgi:hypothetical protein